MDFSIDQRTEVSNHDSSTIISLAGACQVAAWILAALAFLTSTLPLVSSGAERLTATLALTQDLIVAPILALVLLTVRRGARPRTGQCSLQREATLWIAGAIALIVLVGWAGHYLVFSGYDLSRDEQMATFDTAIFRKGHLFAPIPLQWRSLAGALNLTYILPIGAHEFWVSAYLPIDAAWRAAVSYFADPALASPLMAALGGLAIWQITRLLWPDSRGTQLIAVLLYVGSSQMLVTAMTTFAMSMDLALNMLWLWLFLLDTRRTHAAAIIVGWLATGVHEPLLHPLFVLPFLIALFSEKRWKLLVAYLLAYSFIGAFWLAWPIWISGHGTLPAASIAGTAPVGFFQRLGAVLKMQGHNWPWTMAANLLRFFCWQHPLLIPLAIVGTLDSIRRQPICRALAIGFILPIGVMAVLLPWQGYGWGYRYLQPVLGNAILLAAYGWRSLESRIDLSRVAVWTSAVAVFFLFPIHAIMANRMASPFAQLYRALESTDADAVIVDATAVPYGVDLVVNPPDLANRPKLLMADSIRPSDLEGLCRWGSVAFVPGPQLASVARLFRSDPPKRPGPKMALLMAQARRVSCAVKVFSGRR